MIRTPLRRRAFKLTPRAMRHLPPPVQPPLLELDRATVQQVGLGMMSNALSARVAALTGMSRPTGDLLVASALIAGANFLPKRPRAKSKKRRHHHHDN
jgi:hypothetical protein